jgi:glycolate dehydrogenase FAD-binding subunit
MKNKVDDFMKQKIDTIKEQVSEAIEQRKPLKIVGGNSKAFLGRNTAGTSVEMADYEGIISYEPTELYITARAGTLLSDIKKALAKHGQMLAFEPAEVTGKTTIGGVVATGLSGPRRPYAGSVRDYVLGVRCINGLGKDMSFGGQVMKNVAGYDLSRLMTGAFGTLGIIIDVTLKVLPIPDFELTGIQQMSIQKALDMMHQLSAKAIPVSASCYDGDLLHIRLSGNEKVVNETLSVFNLEEYNNGDYFWNELRDFKSPVFNSVKPVWRLSVPSTSDLKLDDDMYLIDWGGAQYWLASERPAKDVYAMARELNGSAFSFLNGDRNGDVFQPLSDELLKLHQGLKNAFDPHRILNPGKMYATL